MDISTGIQKLDLSGKICALVKVQLPIAGVKFEGNIIETKFDVNEYLVYLSPGSKFLSVKCPNIKTLRINFSEFENIQGLESKGIYNLTICVKKEGVISVDKDRVKSEYLDLVSRANSNFDKKLFNEARALYDEAIKPYYSEYFNYESFAWINLCDSIIAAQLEFKAVTPQLARAFSGFDSLSKPMGFSEGMMVIDNGYGHITIVSTKGDRFELNDAFVETPMLYCEGRLSVNLNNSPCYIDNTGKQVLGFRNSNYNKLFKEPNLNFGQFENGYAKIFNNKNGKYGIINSYGHTILNLTGKFEGLTIFKWNIILYDKNHIYRWEIPNQNSPLLNRKLIYEILDYDGYLFGHNITTDYIIISNRDLKTVEVYSFDDRKIYSYDATFAYPVSSTHILLRKDNFPNTLNSNGVKTSNLYTIVNYKTGQKAVTFEDGKVIGNGLVFDGCKCYDTHGQVVFALDTKVEFSSAGFNDGYMLVKSNNQYKYIDMFGNTLNNSSFEAPRDMDHLIGITSWSVRPFNDGFGLIMKDGKWGLIDRFGTTTFDYQ